MNFSDLFIVMALASVLYGVVVALTRQKNFLMQAVNPHRATWLFAALAILWAGLSILRWEAGSWNLSDWGPLMRKLVTEEPASLQVKGASLAIFLGFIFLLLIGWCTFFLPRAPSTFRKPEHRKSAFRYYVTSLRGGLDYALLACGDGEILEEGTDLRQINLRCKHLPKIQESPEQPPRLRTADDQIQFWRRLAANLHQRMSVLDELIEPGHQGKNRRIFFDAEFGGFFFKYLRAPDPTKKVDHAIYLFAATLDQYELNNRKADEHFYLLLEALEQIDRSIRVD